MPAHILIVILGLLTACAHAQAQGSCDCTPVSSSTFSNPDSVSIDTCGLEAAWTTCAEAATYAVPSRMRAKQWWSVQFDVEAIALPALPADSVVEVGWQAIDPSYASLRDGMQDLEALFGPYALRKAAPNQTVGPDGQRFRLRFLSPHRVDSVLDAMQKIPDIAFEFGSGFGFAASVPDDPGLRPGVGFYTLRARQPGDDVEWSEAYHRTGWQWQLYRQKLPLAWELTRGRRSTVLCDRDYWFNPATHPDFYTGVNDPLRNFTWVDAATSLGNGKFATVPFRDGHGRGVTSMMVAKGGNGLGMTGTCPNCNAVGTIVGAYDWAQYPDLDADLSNDADPFKRDRMAVVTLPYAGPGGFDIDMTIRAGIIVVASGLNRQGPNSVAKVPSVNYPASLNWTPVANDPAQDYRVITVGATRDGDTYSENCALWNYDGSLNALPRAISRGPEEFMWNFNYSPGTNKFSTAGDATQRRTDKEAAFMDLTAGTGYTLEAEEDGGGDYKLASGTSQSAPQVAGVCGLMVSIDRYLGAPLDAHGLPLDGKQVQRRAYNILTFTADKVDDDGFTNQGIPAPAQPQYVRQANDPLRRSWAQRMGFGRLNAYRAAAHAIPTKGLFQYTAASALDRAGIPTRNEADEALMHWGAWKSQGVAVMDAGGVTPPGGDARHENMGVTRLDGTGVAVTVGDHCVLAIDGILTTANPNGGNRVVSAAGGSGRILMNGYLDNVELRGNMRIADLTVNAAAGTSGGMISLGSAGAVCEAYENIRLINDARLRVDQGTMRLKTGCTVDMQGAQNLVVTGGGTLRMESASTISGVLGRTVIVESGSRFEVAANAQAEIFANVIVRSGATMTIEAGATVTLDHFTVEPGGVLTIEQGSKVILNRPDVNLCQGKLYVNGTASAPVTISGRVDSWRDLTCCRSVCTHVNQASSILVQGSLQNIGASFLHLAHANVTNVPIRAVTVAKDAILNCAFSGDRSLLARGTYLLSLELGTAAGIVTPLSAPVYDATVSGCAFRDEAGDLAGPRNTVTYPLNGLRCATLRNVSLISTSFRNLGYSAAPVSCVNVGASHLTSTNANVGIYDFGSAVRQCDDWFSGVDYGSIYYNSKAGTAYDNTFLGTRWGFTAWNSAMQNFRGNTIGEYKIGLYAIDGPLNLAPQGAVRFGRNAFNAGTPVSNAAFPPSSFGNAAPVDIQMWGGQANLFMECGRNDMSATSWLHLNNLGPLVKSVAVGTNKWNAPNGPFVVRRSPNILVGGTPLNVSQTVPKTCTDQQETDVCQQSAGMPYECAGYPYYNDGSWMSLPSGGSLLDTIYLTARSIMTNPGLDAPCRRIAARDALYAARLSDSVTSRLRQLVADYDAIARQPSVATDLASHVLMLRAEAHLALDERDSASADFQRIVTGFPSSLDSIPAAWGTLYTQTLNDPIGYGDAYHDRVLSDLRRLADSQEVFPRRTVASPEAVTGFFRASIDDVRASRAAHEAIVSYTISDAGHIRLALYDAEGRLVNVAADRDEGAGRHEMTIGTDGLASGIYLLHLRVNGVDARREMRVTK